ncbi:TetR/AcrR family transcriptional regulator [Oxalicibacterium solurbis]|uniref:TetR family transcriptional regulator n=1 Tax=Oxalicibacterium solurbis TaxID=69280 RepID=A0A8J3AWQ9_9BURK|nr:TetR/AcrR family transcriptional regulator [Oxalicibacterium solurbis]GGI54620.1 TetR family transcriptional regulator [Oxalicibacterium solurbis]
MQTDIDTPNDTLKKLLDTTERLIYAGGIGATGMDQIVKVSGVARKTIYRHFKTKDELVAEALRKRDERWMNWFITESEKGGTPAGKLLATFDALEQWFFTPDFRGCAFINAAGEIGDPTDPIRAVSKLHKVKLHDYLLQLTKEYGAADPEELAYEFLMLIDGAITVALVMNDRNAARKGKQLARKLLGNRAE